MVVHDGTYDGLFCTCHCVRVSLFQLETSDVDTV
jgi:hypothetical protein